MGGNGHIIYGLPISVDYWTVGANKANYLYFLTHLHADHIVGLNNKWSQPIFTSPINAKLLQIKFKIHKDFIKPLELEEEHLIDFKDGFSLVVRLFDAHHCPGSVMFLFQHSNQNILYTGDMRNENNKIPILPSIDILYLDNTYCEVDCNFETRKKAANAILAKIMECLYFSERIFIGIDNLGKEELIQFISKSLNTKVWVDEDRKKVFELIGLGNYVTTDENECKLFAIKSMLISGARMKRLNEEKPTCGILPTSKFCGLDIQPFAKHKNIHVLSYSNHSCYRELEAFVKGIKPKRIIPIVNKKARGIFGLDISKRADMKIFAPILKANTNSINMVEFLKKSTDLSFEISKSLYQNKRSNIVIFPKEVSEFKNKTKNTLCANSLILEDCESRKLEQSKHNNKKAKKEFSPNPWEVICIQMDASPKKFLYTEKDLKKKKN